MQRHKRYVCEETKACLFTVCLIILCLGCFGTLLTESGPLVLGTELNANGQVEYLCLGWGCENLPPMK